MLQFLFVLLVSLAGGSLAVYPDHSSGNDLGSDGNFGNSYGYGYSGGFSGAGAPPQNFPFPPGLDFSNFFDTLNRYQQDLFKNIQAQAAATQNYIPTRSNFPGAGGGGASSYGGGYGGSFGSGDGGSFGGSFSGGYPGAGGFQFIPGAGVGGAGAGVGGPGAGVGGTFTPNGQGASAFGSIGPGGIQQGASVFPENPNTPNVNVRFGSDQPDGFKSVFTSSSSFTRDVDGQPKTVQKATTTVNDNGKITTYTRNSP